MSTAFALAAITAVIKYQIDNGLVESNLNDIRVSLLPPDKIDTGEEGGSKLNLFLYRVTPNQGWQNNDLPSYNSKGERVSNPKLSIDLHYLITSSCSSYYQSEILLGTAMQILHSNPVLGRDMIRKALENDNLLLNTLNRDEIKNSGLENQIEQIKITFQNLNIEEISKLWSSFQTNYRLTVSYLVTVVLIESYLSAKSSLPVTGRNIYAVPFNNPAIEKIYLYEGGNIFITISSKIVVKGQNFPSENMKLFVSDIDFTDCIEKYNDKEVIVQFKDTFPDGIYSGVQSLKISGNIDIGSPPVPHKAIESNEEVFIIHPIIEPLVENLTEELVNNIQTKKGNIRTKFNPNVIKKQKITLFLNEYDPPSIRSARSYSFPAPVNNGIPDPDTESSEVIFSFKNVEPGKYLVRTRVDGADSLLKQELDPDSPEYLKFINPVIEI